MKEEILLLLLFLFLNHISIAQSVVLERTLIGSQGSFYQGAFSVESSIGEPVTGVIENSIHLSQGFRQGTSEQRALAITAVHLTGQRQAAHQVSLQWVLEIAETTADKIIIKRKKQTDKAFSLLTILSGEQNYQDSQAPAETCLYQLEVSKNNQIIAVSNIVSIPEKRHKWAVFPNPFIDELLIKSNITITEPAELSLYDQKGKKVFSDYFSDGNCWKISKKLNDLLPATYLLLIRQGRKISTFEIIKL